MTRTRLDSLYLLLLGSAVFLLAGIAMEKTAPGKAMDFKGLYYPARSLVQHRDPYAQSEVLRVYQADGGDRAAETAKGRQIATQNVYPPSAFFLTAPFAFLPWGPAHTLWLALIAGSLIIASFLIWNLAADYAPILSGALVGFFLANSEVLMITGNAAGIVVSLCAVAVWCFLRNRYVFAGALCFAVSLALKPHDTGLVWLYFLLAGGVYRKRALQTLLATVLLGLPGALWVSFIAPHWIQEMHSNILAFSAHGGINDPGLASIGGHGLDMLISLQTIFSTFRDEPRFYNPASYLICLPLLVLWAIVTVRCRPSPKRAWLALAAIAALSMLPIYHRQLDAKLLLLTVPACAMLWAEGGPIAWFALVLNSAGFVLTGDLPWSVFLAIISSLHPSSTGLSRPILTDMQMFPVPLILLIIAIFYLWVYLRHAFAPAPQAGNPEPHDRLIESTTV